MNANFAFTLKHLRPTPSNSPLRRGRVDYQAVSPPVQGGVRGGSH